jgi:hypothetical protein
MSVRVIAFCIVLLTATMAAAQSQPALQIGIRQGSYYWVIETALDGTRRGGWVPVNVPLDSIDRNALKPLPPASAPSQAEALPPAPSSPPSIDERLARIEQALTTSPGVAQQPLDAAQPTTVAPVRQQQPRPQPSPPVQNLQAREGFWFNGGLGVGFAGCLDCVGREVGTSGGLSLGGTLSERVLLGFGTTGWYRNINGITYNGGTFDARLRFYPSVSSGFFLTGGGGLGTVSESNGFVTNREVGPGVLFGLGWDLRVGRNVSLTPFYNGFAVGVDSGTYFVDQFGLSVTFH